jgi:hypothetical protein
MTKKTLKKKNQEKQLREMLIDLELGNGTMLNEQLYNNLNSYKRNKKIQKQIHDRQDWRNYIK